MASTPTTKSQVQAYRFVIRRMESALVRKDPVMLHDPMRSHKRATVVGVIAAAVGLIGFAVVGLFSSSPTLPTTGIVIGSQSGQVYVVSGNPSELIPVFNVASARLLMMVEANKGNPIVPSPQGSSGSSSSAPQITNPVTVSDSQLKNIPMGRLTGIPDGPQQLPAPGSGNSNWAVCDQLPTDASAANQQPQTTVLAGESNIGTNLQQGQALLAKGPNNNQEYLIYDRTSNTNNAEDDSTVAAPIDSSDTHVLDALNIQSEQPRLISAALLGAIPQVNEIQDPVRNIPGYGSPPPNYTLPGITVGESFGVTNASGPDSYYVALSDGIQSVTPTVAQIVLFEHNQNTFTRLSGFQIGNIKPVNELNVASYPDSVPQVVETGFHPVTCLGWTADTSNPLKKLVRTRVTIDTKLELPPDPNNSGAPMLTVPIGQPSPDGEKIDAFFMNPSFQSIAVHAATGPEEFSNGPIYIVSGRGVKYSVEDELTAQGLGIANAGTSDGLSAAPESILRLLPSSAQTLSTENVMHTYDSVPVPSNAGLFMTPASNQNAPSGGN
jgi:type VII secretion protein EccB